MEPFEPWRRMGSHGRLLDVSLLRALLLPGPKSAAALNWLERVGEGELERFFLGRAGGWWWWWWKWGGR